MLYEIVKRLVVPVRRLVLRPVVEGLGNVPRTGPVIVASNHLSFVDSVVIPMVIPRRVTFLAKAEYFEGRGLKGRIVRTLFEALGAVPVPRGRQRAAMAALEVALQVLAAGQAFGIYPEGTRSRDGRLYRGRTGVAWLALASGAPVVPVALIGTDRLYPIGRRLPRMHRVTLRFGTPLDFTRYAGQAGSGRVRRAVTDEIMQAIHGLSEQDYVDSYNEHASAA